MPFIHQRRAIGSVKLATPGKLLSALLLGFLCISCGDILQGTGPKQAPEFGESSSRSERKVEEAFMSALAMYNAILEGRKESSHKNWENAIQRFRRVVRTYPRGKFADDAQYNIGLCYVWTHGIYKDSPQKAVSAFEHLIKQYPDSELLDSAYYWKAYAHSLNGDYERAIEEYESFMAKYPQSEFYNEAIYQISECKARIGARGKLEGEIPISKGPPDPGPRSDANKIRYVHVKDISFHSWQEFTHVVLDVSGPVRYKVQKLESPDRIYLDIRSAVVTPGKQTIKVNDRRVKDIRIAQFNSTTVRIVLDIKEVKRYSIFSLKDPDRIVIDVY